MSISICIPTYNRLEYLKKCLSSILDGIGNYPYELIIADGGSTDGTIEYLENLGNDNLTLIKQGKLVGASRAWNACFKKAKNEYVFWPCDDYIINPNVILNCCKIMDKYPEIGLASPKFIEATLSNFPNIGSWQYLIVLSKTHVFRNSVLKEIGFFDDNFKTYYIDVDSHIAVLNLGYTTLFTREVGIIHNRFFDEIRKKNIQNKTVAKSELDYYKQKWKKLDDRLIASYPKRFKAKVAWSIHDRLRQFGLMQKFMKNNHPFAIKMLDWFLQKSVIFEAKEFRHLKDFYLAQRIPPENKKST